MKTCFLIFCFTLISFNSFAQNIITAVIPPEAPFRQGTVNFLFGEVAQNVTVSSFFNIKNVSSLQPVNFVIPSIAPFRVSPSTGFIPPNATLKITVSFTASAPPADITKELIINATRGSAQQQIKNWFVNAKAVEPKPNLIVQASSQSIVREGNKTKVIISVLTSNAPNLVRSQPCQGELYLDNQVVANFALPAFDPGKAASQSITFETSKTGTHQVRAKVDSNNANAELRENDNEGILSINLP